MIRSTLTLCATGLLLLVARAHAQFDPLSLRQPSFEGQVLAWEVQGECELVPSRAATPSYFGQRSLRMRGGTARIRQPIDWKVGDGAQLEAGVWVALERLDETRGVFELQLSARGPDVRSVVAYGRLEFDQGTADDYRFLLAPARSDVPVGTTQLVLQCSKSFAGSVRLDYAQVALANGATGVPRKHVAASYVGWYRSPRGPDASAGGSTPREKWQNWAWLSPPHCDLGTTALRHNPDCETSANCVRANGRRDAAVSVEFGIDHLPLIGTYDSRDVDVVRYHVELAQAAGLDSFVYTYMGHALAQQSALAGERSVNELTLERLFDQCDVPARDLKVAVMYEPKVHMLGWVQGQSSFAQRKNGIIDDLVYFARTYGARRSLLRRRGRIPVYVFWPTICMPNGPCLDDADWADIQAAVESATGERLLFISSNQPDAQSTFEGFLNWRLVDSAFLRYTSYADFKAGTPSSPPATLAGLRDHARAIDVQARAWAAEQSERFVVAMAWPGFDDSGVAGWGQPNGVGSNGLSLCVRVAAVFAGEFFKTTLDVALAPDTDWVHVATWNDWNEHTAIEPNWSADYKQAVLTGAAPPAAALADALGRLLELQREIARFKNYALGVHLFPLELHTITRSYLLAASGPGVVEYD